MPIPVPGKRRDRIILEGDVPSPANPPSGCRFRTRCPKFSLLNESQQAQCLEAMPEQHSMGPDHEAACYFAEHQAVF